MRSFVSFLFLVFLFVQANATELFQLGENTRSYGMGGVRVTDEKEAAAFLWNPANLSYMKGMNLEVVDFSFDVNGKEAYDNFKGVDFSKGISSYSSLYGKQLRSDAEGYSAFTLPYFGVAVYDKGYLDMMLHDPAFPSLDVTYQNDYAFAMGGSVSLWPYASFGMTAKRINRLGGPQKIGFSTLNSGLSQDALIGQFTNEGIGYGLDSGFIQKVPGPLDLTFGAAWQDMGSTAFTKTHGNDAPERIKDNLTLSATFQQDLLLLGFAGGIEYRHITDEDTLGKKLNMGLEVSLLNMDIRGGLYQGYPTYGAGIDLWLLQLDAAIYTVEEGAYPGQTPSQRYQVGFSMNFGFDPDFNLTDAGGKRRRMKQRR